MSCAKDVIKETVSKQANMHRVANIMEQAKGSPIWRYFTPVMPTSLTAACNICKVNVQRGGDKTTSLIKHFKRFHSKQHTEFMSSTLVNLLVNLRLLHFCSIIS